MKRITRIKKSRVILYFSRLFQGDPFFWALAVFCLGLLAVVAVHYVSVSRTEGSHSRLAVNISAIRPDDHVTGNPKAPVRLYLYMDAECPHCKRLHESTLPKLFKKYGGIFYITYRHLPLNIHPSAFKEAEALECAYEQKGNDAFFKFISDIYRETQSDNTFPPERLSEIAGELGLSVHKFDTCLKNEETRARVERDFNESAAMGINISPSIVIEGNYPARINAAVDAILKAQQ